MIDLPTQAPAQASTSMTPPAAQTLLAVSSASASVVVAELLALMDGGATAFIGLPAPGAGAAAPTARARTVVDLHAGHVGQPVLLVFEQGDPQRPIVVGVVRTPETPPVSESVARIARAEVDADGQHLVVTARHALTLRCGKARLTLRADGRIELRGEEILAQAAGANRIQGGSVHLN